MISMSQVLFSAFSNPYNKPRGYYYSTLHIRLMLGEVKNVLNVLKVTKSTAELRLEYELRATRVQGLRHGKVCRLENLSECSAFKDQAL